MPADEQFKVAAERHFSDGEYLHKDGRLPNADHHYGFAAECAVKALMHWCTDVALELTPQGNPQKPKAKTKNPATGGQWNLGHIQHLLEVFPLLENGRFGPSLPAALGMLAVFRDWNEHERYADGSAVTVKVVEERGKAAREVLVLLGCVVTYGKLTP